MNIIERAAALLAEKTLVNERVDDQIAKERLGICESCNFLDQDSRRCKVCKCFVDAKTKAQTNFNPKTLRNEITHCPNGFWNDIETANFYRKIDGVQPIVNLSK